MLKQKLRSTDSHFQANATILTSGSLSVALAVKLLDKRIRAAARLFDIWYRHCAAVALDKQVLGFQKLSHAKDLADRFDRLRSKTYSAIFENNGIEPEFKAIECAVNLYGWPVATVLDVLHGFRMDFDGRSYATIAELMAYCYRIAGSVGVGMAEMLGVDANDPWMMDRACDLGIAFQMTKIAGNVMEDAKGGRVYLPAELFLSGPASPEFILDPGNRSAVIAATHVLLDLAGEHYASAELAIAELPWRTRLVTAIAAGSCRVVARRIRWSDDPWPVEPPAQFWTKILNTISFCGQIVFKSMTPFRFNPDPENLWTRSAYLKHRN